MTNDTVMKRYQCPRCPPLWKGRGEILR